MKYLPALIIINAFLIVTASAAVSQYNLTVGSDTVIIFNGTGNLSWTVPSGVTSAWVLVVGGGGSGGGGSGANGNNYGGGGGAGALLNGTMVLVPTTSMSLTVGGGGIPGLNGNFSQFNNTEIAAGGGGGRGAGGTSSDGLQGGSGGGAGSITGTRVAGASNATSGLSLTAYGYRGGYAGTADPSGGGGGGGAGGVGQNGSVSNGGYGGACWQSNISGVLKNYSAGGSGNRYQTAQAGICPDTGGAASTDAVNPTNGVDGTGSGGGGSWSTRTRSYGGSGVVIVRYTTPVAPTASFTANTTGGVGSVAVQFNDTSTGTPAMSAWNWSFTNVTPGNNTAVWFSTVQNASYTFGVGNWSIQLNATNAAGSNLSTQKTFVNVSQYPLPVAAFTSNTTGGVGSVAALFTDTSTNTPTSWSWSFNNITPGNNTFVAFSTSQNPTYSFKVGNWSIRLNATNLGGTNTSTQTTFINVSQYPSPVASFSANKTSGSTPLAVQFTDTSSNSPEGWNWSFNNITGNDTFVLFDTTQNPVYIFDIGNWSIRLNITAAGGDNTSAQTTFINVSEVPPIEPLPNVSTSSTSCAINQPSGTGGEATGIVFGIVGGMVGALIITRRRES